MKIEIETNSYNDRRYGKPYIATIDFDVDPKGAAKFGIWIGSEGYAGILQLECQPGDVLMRGQKDNRNPRYSAPDYGFVNVDGSVTWGLTKAAAYKLWDDFEQCSPEVKRAALEEEKAKLQERLTQINTELISLK